MSSLSYVLADKGYYRLLNLLIRIKLICWAILGRPIIYGYNFKSGFKLTKNNRNVLIVNNSFGIKHDRPGQNEERKNKKQV